MTATSKLMTKTEIKEEAQRLLLNDGAGAFLHLTEDVMEPLEWQVKRGAPLTAEYEMELKNAQALEAEMDKQFNRMKKFFLYESFWSTH